MSVGITGRNLPVRREDRMQPPPETEIAWNHERPDERVSVSRRAIDHLARADSGHASHVNEGLARQKARAP